MQCVMCGRYTPEGRQACKRCEGGGKIDDRDTRQTTKPKRHHRSCQKSKGKYQPYAIMKEQYTSDIGWLAKKLPAYERVDITITWYEPNRRRDPDNITGGQKFILDGLVRGGVIPDDSQKYIAGIIHRFRVDKRKPRVEVEIIGVNNAKKGMFEINEQMESEVEEG